MSTLPLIEPYVDEWNDLCEHGTDDDWDRARIRWQSDERLRQLARYYEEGEDEEVTWFMHSDEVTTEQYAVMSAFIDILIDSGLK